MTRLEEPPIRMDRLESQIVQLRFEMGDEFYAVRWELRAGDEETRREMRDGFAQARLETTAGDEETRHYMRMLFEEYVGRMKVVGEADAIQRGRRPRKKARRLTRDAWL